MRAQLSWWSAAVLVVALTERASAQQVQGAVSLSGGSATDVLGVTSRAVTLAPSLSIVTDPRVAFTFDGNATRFDNSQWSAGAGANTSLRAPIGKFAAFTLNAGANATSTSYDFSYYTASALPALEARLGVLTAYVGARGGLASTSATRVAQTTPAGPFGGNPLEQRSTVATSRTMRGALFGANVRIPGAGGETMIAGLREEHSTIDTTPTVDRSASLTVLNGRVTLAGTAGVRSEPGARSTFGSGGLSVALNGTTSVELNAGSYPADRLIGTPAGRYLNLGLSLRTGHASPPSLPAVDGVPEALAGFTRVSIRADDATRVDVLGDFTNWKPIATHRAPNGVWYVDLRIPAGQYRYAFKVNGGDWRIPEGATAVDDDFGGKSAWLVVSAPSTTSHPEDE